MSYSKGQEGEAEAYQDEFFLPGMIQLFLSSVSALYAFAYELGI